MTQKLCLRSLRIMDLNFKRNYFSGYRAFITGVFAVMAAFINKDNSAATFMNAPLWLIVRLQWQSQMVLVRPLYRIQALISQMKEYLQQTAL